MGSGTAARFSRTVLTLMGAATVALAHMLNGTYHQWHTRDAWPEALDRLKLAAVAVTAMGMAGSLALLGLSAPRWLVALLVAANLFTLVYVALDWQ